MNRDLAFHRTVLSSRLGRREYRRIGCAVQRYTRGHAKSSERGPIVHDGLAGYSSNRQHVESFGEVWRTEESAEMLVLMYTSRSWMGEVEGSKDMYQVKGWGEIAHRASAGLIRCCKV